MTLVNMEETKNMQMCDLFQDISLSCNWRNTDGMIPKPTFEREMRGVLGNFKPL